MREPWRVFIGVIVVAVGAISGGGEADATTVLQVGVDALTATSEWIVDARVLAVEDVDERPRGGGLSTDVTLAFDAIYKGDEDTPDTYVLRLPGGHGRDGLTLAIPGMPRFVVGERVLLFLEKTSAGHIPCGLGQGVWRVTEDPQGRAWVSQSIGGLHVVRRSPQGALSDAPTPAMSPAMTLGQLAAEIDEALRHAAPRR